MSEFWHRSDILTQRVDRAALATPFGSLKVKTQLCILQNRQLFCNLAALYPDRNPFSKICESAFELICMEFMIIWRFVFSQLDEKGDNRAGRQNAERQDGERGQF